MEVFHYTDEAGFKGISSAPDWRFIAGDPPAEHPRGTYFTDYNEQTVQLAAKLRIPKTKTEFRFCFSGNSQVEVDGFIRIRGGRGLHIFYSPTDYVVNSERQLRKGRVDPEDRRND